MGEFNCNVLFILRDKPVCGHSITIRETVSATSVDFTGAKAFEISGQGFFIPLCAIWIIVLFISYWVLLVFALLIMMLFYSGTPVDCISLSLSGRLFAWSAPALVLCLLSMFRKEVDVLLFRKESRCPIFVIEDDSICFAGD